MTSWMLNGFNFRVSHTFNELFNLETNKNHYILKLSKPFLSHKWLFHPILETLFAVVDNYVYFVENSDDTSTYLTIVLYTYYSKVIALFKKYK